MSPHRVFAAYAVGTSLYGAARAVAYTRDLRVGYKDESRELLYTDRERRRARHVRAGDHRPGRDRDRTVGPRHAGPAEVVAVPLERLLPTRKQGIRVRRSYEHKTMQRAIMRAQVRKLKAKARVVSTPEQWYEIVHGPMAGVVVSDRGRALVGGVPTDADVVPEQDQTGLNRSCDHVDVAAAACYAWNGPPQPDAFGHVAFRNGDVKDRSFKNVFWATVTGKPVEYDLEIRHVNGDFLDNRRENLFRNDDPRLPAACWAVRHNGPSGA